MSWVLSVCPFRLSFFFFFFTLFCILAGCPLRTGWIQPVQSMGGDGPEGREWGLSICSPGFQFFGLSLSPGSSLDTALCLLVPRAAHSPHSFKFRVITSPTLWLAWGTALSFVLSLDPPLTLCNQFVFLTVPKVLYVSFHQLPTGTLIPLPGRKGIRT